MIILILTLVFALLVAIFAVQNADSVIIQFFWVTEKVPLVLVILASALAGALIVFLLAIWREFRYKRKKAVNSKPLATSDVIAHKEKEETPEPEAK
ncbi:Protein of unknown function (DUF1049) [Desulfosporosinus acidiphilus SJ4]|uniref:Lipopolysaccharide assembly protein A domain-containing protein n=1 Tax=Desulfosporosinus acidiphilus (strain DSM 22704 / JCM 16185 / SJ4) TaxID=646529 RepID=I4D922_DESAJ|nr:LapA family protein [Desulfosporosinus acidiphilus]AFM42296.1 Protein of unknown function (DUF1049) [Desulfosporosinus acidiphilus SJ4]